MSVQRLCLESVQTRGGQMHESEQARMQRGAMAYPATTSQPRTVNICASSDHTIRTQHRAANDRGKLPDLSSLAEFGIVIDVSAMVDQHSQCFRTQSKFVNRNGSRHPGKATNLASAGSASPLGQCGFWKA